MNDQPLFEPPDITDEDISWASGVLRLPSDAFHGEDGKDPRQEVLKSIGTIDVAACPGSGKTTLLVAKLAILAEKWRYQTRGICVVSHTNVARDEIETKLGNTTAGRRLLSYPHFIGTIHKFVNDFLAGPWLRSRDYSINMIDTDICVKRRWNALPYGTRKWLERNNYGPSLLSIKSLDFGVGEVRRGKGSLSRASATYTNIREACKASISKGDFCHDEMFIFARELIDQMPGIIAVLRDRFPLLFVDEAQDNSDDQSAILNRIFMDGNGAVVRQRFGDENQAIFDSMYSEEAHTDKFPDLTIRTDLPNSHRFGQRIASLADPLGLAPYPSGLRGEGPREELLAPGVEEGRHTVFVFDDGTITRVLDAYGQLLLETFSEEVLNGGVFTAVGQVHKDSGDDHKPRHVGHYWPEYDPELSTKDPKPQTFAQYVLAGMAKAKMAGEAFPAAEKIADGILRLAGMANGDQTIQSRQRRHRQVVELLKGHTRASDLYAKVVDRFAVRREAPTKEIWNDSRRNIVRQIAETMANGSLSGPEVEAFLAWPDDSTPPTSTSVATKIRDNIFTFSNDGKEVSIRVGSIHSVKGQTHSATLVLETFYHTYNLEQLVPWLVGDSSGGADSVALQQSRLKVHYVAMTRPTHLLCLAMKASTLTHSNGEPNAELIERFENRGWRIKVI
jgi:hypothetical protein